MTDIHTRLAASTTEAPDWDAWYLAVRTRWPEMCEDREVAEKAIAFARGWVRPGYLMSVAEAMVPEGWFGTYPVGEQRRDEEWFGLDWHKCRIQTVRLWKHSGLRLFDMKVEVQADRPECALASAALKAMEAGDG